MEERIPFDIKYRPEIEAGQLLVETMEGEPVRIICWDRKGEQPIVGLLGDERLEEVDTFYTNGGYIRGHQSNHDLYLVPNLDHNEPATEPSITAKPSVDWGAFRREVAKDIVAAHFANPNFNGVATESIVKISINVADELIRNLKREKK